MTQKKATSVADALFSSVQQRILGLLFGQPDRSFYTNEIGKLGNTGRGALQRELEKLARSGLVEVTRIGHQKHYQANKKSLIFNELRCIMLKTCGVADILRMALSGCKEVGVAFVYGSVAKGTDTAASDIDLMVVADGLDYSRLFEMLGEPEQTLGRKINPSLYAYADFERKLADGNHFITRVLSQPKIMVIGDESAIPTGKPAEPAEDRETEGRTPGSERA